MPKLYFNDLGLRNFLLNNFSEVEIRIDKGQVLENYTFLRLSELYRNDDIKFWKTADQKEVDFILIGSANRGKAYEVKFNAASIKPSKYKTFIKTYPEYDFHFVEYLFSKYQNTMPVLKL